MPARSWTVDQVDSLRTELSTAIASPSFQTWVNLEITTAPLDQP